MLWLKPILHVAVSSSMVGGTGMTVHIAERLTAAVVQGGASRHVAAAMAATSLRLAAFDMHGMQDDKFHIDEDVNARMCMVELALRGMVAAEVDQRQPRVSGCCRTARNVALHTASAKEQRGYCSRGEKQNSDSGASGITLTAICSLRRRRLLWRSPSSAMAEKQ